MALANVELSYTSVNGVNCIVATAANSNNVSVSVAIDYTPYVIRIMTALEYLNVSISNIDFRANSNTLGLYTKSAFEDGGFTAEEQRAITMNAIKESGSLESVQQELANPTPLTSGDN